MPLRSFGRIKARSLKPKQAELFDTLLPSLTANSDWLAAQARSGRDLILEIGFGGGEHLVAQAIRAPHQDFLGCEPFLNGVGSALRHIDEAKLNNIAIHCGDAREIMARLPDASLSGVYALFADPWPKARHHKRRLIQSEWLLDLARVMKPGARFRFATDWTDYADWALERVERCGWFEWPAASKDDWLIPPSDHVTTRYETKQLGDCAPVYFDFYRVRRDEASVPQS